MSKIALDMDPGIDDALALILALKSPELQVLGVTTVAGNGSVEMTSANARRVLECLNADSIPVAMGAANPLSRPLEDALDYHGADGLGNCSLPPPSMSLHASRAWEFLRDVILDAPGEITLVATGPLTNVARAFMFDSGLPNVLAKLVIMGGAYGLTPYGKGNRTLYAEFNIWQDPEAARVVFESGADIFAVGLDASMDPVACLNEWHLERIRTGETPAAHLAAQLVEYDMKHHGCCRMHDPLALATLVDASLLDFASVRVEVVEGDSWGRGITRILPSDGLQSIHVACGVAGPRFIELFLSRILES